MNTNLRFLIAAMAATMALSACNETNPSPAPSAAENPDAAYTREVQALKGAGLEPASLEAALRAVRARFGGNPAQEPERPGSGTEAVPAPAAKASATALTDVKFIQFGLNDVMHTVRSVAPGQTLESWTSRPAGSTTDPYIIGFYKFQPQIPGNGYVFRLVGASDDRASGNLDGYFAWTNTTAITQEVTVIGFAYSQATQGTASLHYKTTSSKSASGFFGGKVQFFDNRIPAIPSNCTYSGKDRLMLTQETGGGFGIGVIGVNLRTKTGAHLIEGPVDLENPTLSWSINLLDPIGSGPAEGFILGVTLVQEDIREASRFHASQARILNCR